MTDVVGAGIAQDGRETGSNPSARAFPPRSVPREGSRIGTLGKAPVVARRLFGARQHHDQALSLARHASRALSGAPVVVVREGGASAADVTGAAHYVVLQAALAPGVARPTMTEVLDHPVRQHHEEQRMVTDIVFGEVSMVVPGSMTVSPWLYLLE